MVDCLIYWHISSYLCNFSSLFSDLGTCESGSRSLLFRNWILATIFFSYQDSLTYFRTNVYCLFGKRFNIDFFYFPFIVNVNMKHSGLQCFKKRWKGDINVYSISMCLNGRHCQNWTTSKHLISMYGPLPGCPRFSMSVGQPIREKGQI